MRDASLLWAEILQEDVLVLFKRSLRCVGHSLTTGCGWIDGLAERQTGYLCCNALAPFLLVGTGRHGDHLTVWQRDGWRSLGPWSPNLAHGASVLGVDGVPLAVWQLLDIEIWIEVAIFGQQVFLSIQFKRP